MKIRLASIAIGLSLAVSGSAHAGVVFSENFDTGSATYTTNDPYWLDQSLANGYIINNTTQVSAFPFGNAIPQDVSGTGYFLFEGTASYPVTGNIPAGQDQFYISPVFAVTPNTTYLVSFYATDANGINNPLLQPEIGGQFLGSPVSPLGTYSSNGWQLFTFTWNSGTNTSASLILHDLTTTPTGNDFGLDQISVTSVPEPTSMTLLAIAGGTGLAASYLRSRRAERGATR